MNKQDYRDYFILAAVSIAGMLACAFLFLYPSSVNFATWSGFGATLFGAYHWLAISDDKRVDAGNVTGGVANRGVVFRVP